LNANYPGGLMAYIHNARRLLADSKAGKNPFDGYTPSVSIFGLIPVLSSTLKGFIMCLTFIDWTNEATSKANCFTLSMLGFPFEQGPLSSPDITRNYVVNNTIYSMETI
jgi:hypothetical protein